MRSLRGSFSALSLLLALSGCHDKSMGRAAAAQHALSEVELKAALAGYAELALVTYDDSLRGAQQLLAAVQALLSEPSERSLEVARSAWLSARVPYAQSEVFRFYDGPIDEVELWVNTWPIDESYVESLPGEPSLGIIQDREHYPQLSRELLQRLNGQAGETAISTGYHVIEFLLWGRDESENGPGQRSFRDFVPPREGREQSIERRRASYLLLASELLVAQLCEVRDAWRADLTGNYRAAFLALPPRAALYRALKGMAKLSGPELSGERLTVAYETKSQEHEHSCFSDSTQADLANNALGIENVCLGRYRRSAGGSLAKPALCDVLARALPELGARLRTELAASVQATAQIPAPFDRAIQGDDAAAGRTAVAHAISALRAQAQTLEQIKSTLRLSEAGSVAVLP
jgi:putative iron-regulated protein